MPFSLANAPATFERLMENVLAGLQWDICLIYLDDIIVFQKLKGAGLKFKPKKCTLFAKEVAFLDHVISEAGVATDPDKVKCIRMAGTK